MNSLEGRLKGIPAPGSDLKARVALGLDDVAIAEFPDQALVDGCVGEDEEANIQADNARAKRVPDRKGGTRVGWITFSTPVRQPTGGLTSSMASLRYRVLAPISQMGDALDSHQIFPMLGDTLDSVREDALQSDMLIFSKSFLPANEDLAERARARGVKVIFDVCDNHYQHPQYGSHYRAMSALADQVVCNTPEMAEVAAAFSPTAPLVIGDPYEGPRGTPAFTPDPRLKLLWFGHRSNLNSLRAALGDLVAYSARRSISLNVLTQGNPMLSLEAERLNATTGDGFNMTIEPWSLDGQWRALAACDAVVIPSLNNHEKQVKSANRMVESLWAGRPVVAQPLASYEPFRPWTPIGGTLSAGLDWLSANAGQVPALVAQAQAHIATEFAPQVLGRQWRDLIMLHSRAFDR